MGAAKNQEEQFCSGFVVKALLVVTGKMHGCMCMCVYGWQYLLLLLPQPEAGPECHERCQGTASRVSAAYIHGSPFW